MDRRLAQGAPVEIEGARRQKYEELVAKQGDKLPTTAQIIIPVAERLGQNVIDSRNIFRRDMARRC